MCSESMVAFEMKSCAAIARLLSIVLLSASCIHASVTDTHGIELNFQLPQIKGNPFDYTANDVQVTFTEPTGNDVTLPAYFDGETNWGARLMPGTAGRYSVRSITLNGSDAKPQAMSARTFDVPAPLGPGFVTIDPKNKMRFAFDDGSPYYPVGYNLAWRSEGALQMPPLVDSLHRMGQAGVNWSRIWMDYWDGKNLDWPAAGQPRLEVGTLSLLAARKWDEIVSTALLNHVYFQMVLQHHGQYSTTADANWQLNPWNKANGGWLDRPEKFFTDPRALQLTKNKLRYIIARWGYAPSILSFELCNEVESTDGFKKDLAAVAAWHQTMATFIRAQDYYKHLITTSSRTTQPEIWSAMDYYQAHAYPSDIISAIAGLDEQKLDRPYFYGEIGESSSSQPVPTQEVVHQILWSSLMSGAAGAAQYWFWYKVEPQNLTGEFTQIQSFIKRSAMLTHGELHPVQIDLHTPDLAPLQFGPGRDWAPSAAIEFTVQPNGHVKEIGGMSAFLQGSGATHSMFPAATFHVDYPKPGTFSVAVSQTTSAGAKLNATIDERPVASLTIAPRTDREAGNGDKAFQNQSIHFDGSLDLSVTAGKHAIRLENSGADWIQLRQFTLTPYASELAALGKSDDEYAVVWIYRRPSGDRKPAALSGDVTVPGLRDGTYRVVWWNPSEGAILQQQAKSIAHRQPLTFETPLITQDAACWIERESD